MNNISRNGYFNKVNFIPNPQKEGENEEISMNISHESKEKNKTTKGLSYFKFLQKINS